MPLGPVPIFPTSPGAFGTPTSPFTSIVTTSSTPSGKAVIPVGWAYGVNGAHSTLQVNTGTTTISTSPTTLAIASAVWGPIFSDGSSFSIVSDTTGSASNYWMMRGGGGPA